MRSSFGWLLLLTTLPARAADAEVAAPQEKAALRWLRADSALSCPNEAEAKLAIERRLGAGALVAKPRASLVVRVELEALPTLGFHAEIALLRGEEVVGRRELVSEDAACQRLAETAALVIALTIDPAASLEPLPIVVAEEPAPSVVEPPSAPSTKPAAMPPSKPTEVPRPAAPWQGELELAFGIATGIVPNVAAGLHVRGRALPPRLPFGIELMGAYFPAKRLEAAPGKGADFSVFYAGAGLCSRASRTSRIAGVLCAGAQLGAIAGQGYGFDSTPSFQTFTLALAARGAVWFRPRTSLAIVLGPSLFVPLKRDHFETTTAAGIDELFRAHRLGLGFDLGAVWEL